jgi:hypothetical protein
MLTIGLLRVQRLSRDNASFYFFAVLRVKEADGSIWTGAWVRVKPGCSPILRVLPASMRDLRERVGPAYPCTPRPLHVKRPNVSRLTVTLHVKRLLGVLGHAQRLHSRGVVRVPGGHACEERPASVAS